MPLNPRLLNWVDELRATRNDLPLEITRIFGDAEEEQLREAIVDSFAHVERVLDYRKLIDEVSSDPEEFWYDLLATLDDVSYYTCLAVPAVRQLLVPSSRFLFCKDSRKPRGCEERRYHRGFPGVLRNLPEVRRDFGERACLLALDANDVYVLYVDLEEVDDLLYWARRFLRLSGMIIHLAGDIALVR